MKRLVYKLIALGAGTLIVVMVMSIIYMKQHQSSNKKYYNMPYGITLANTGNSHGQHAFDYSIYNGTTFNFAMGSQSIVYDYNLIHYYINHFSKGSTLLIPISYFTFWYDELKSDTFNDKNMRYFSILDAEHMRFKSKKDYYIGKYFSIIQLADINIRSVFDKATNLVDDPLKTDFTIQEIGEKRATYHLRHIRNDFNQIIEMNPSNETSLRALIKLCKEQNITPVLITTPYLHYYTKWFSDDLLKIFYHKINEICNELKVSYLDYSNDRRFAYDEDLFKDTDHLNKKGAKVFTKIIIDDLKRLKLLKQ